MKTDEQDIPKNETEGITMGKINDYILLWLLNDNLSYEEYLEAIKDFD